MKQWQPFSRSQPSRPSQTCLRVCPTHAGTCCGRSLWKRNGDPLLRGFSVTPLSRAAFDLGSLESPGKTPHLSANNHHSAFQGPEKPTNQPTKNKLDHKERMCISDLLNAAWKISCEEGNYGWKKLIALPVLLIRIMHSSVPNDALVPFCWMDPFHIFGVFRSGSRQINSLN